jgi:adenine-specific DNA-methyltransferase
VAVFLCSTRCHEVDLVQFGDVHIFSVLSNPEDIVLTENAIHHGDSLQLVQQLAPRSVDLICSDPPYGGNELGGKNAPPIANNSTPLPGLLVIQRSLAALKLNRFCVLFLNQQHQPFYDTFFRRYTTLRVRGYVVWDKKSMGLGYGVRTQHELIGIYEKGRPAYPANAIPSVISASRADTSEHPNAKPLALMRYLLGKFSSPGDLVLDPFAGSGTTLVAAKASGRRFLGIELDSAYADISRHRLANMEIDNVHTR